MRNGVPPRVACAGAIAQPLSDDADMLRAVNELAASIF
jgi:CbbQ/NirQ/NorQ C-terminal